MPREMYKYKAKSKKGDIVFDYVVYVTKLKDYTQRMYYQPDYDVSAPTLELLKGRLP